MGCRSASQPVGLNRAGPRWVVGLLVAAAGALALPDGTRAHGGDPDRIHACVSDGGDSQQLPPAGTIRITADPTGFGDPDDECDEGEHALDWEQEGPTGPRGEDGDRGKEGDRGEDGEPAKEVARAPEAPSGLLGTLGPAFTPAPSSSSIGMVAMPTRAEIEGLAGVIAGGGSRSAVEGALKDLFDIPRVTPFSVKVVTARSASSPLKTAVASCGPSRVALGGGYRPLGGNLHHIESSRPVGNPPRAWSVAAFPFPPERRNYGRGLEEVFAGVAETGAPVEAYAICATGVESARVTETAFGYEQPRIKNRSAPCYGKAETVTGGGHELSREGGLFGPSASRPDRGTAGPFWNTHAVAPPHAEDARWQLKAYGVCARLPAGSVSFEEKSTPVTNAPEDFKTRRDPRKSVTAECKGGQTLVGGGHGLINPTGGTVVSGVPAPAPAKSYTVTASAPGDYYRTTNWGVRAYALCYKPSG